MIFCYGYRVGVTRLLLAKEKKKETFSNANKYFCFLIVALF